MTSPSYLVHITCVIFVCCFSSFTHAEDVFSAISDCEVLLDTHRVVINDLDDYVRKEEDRLQKLKKQIDSFKKEHETAMEDVSNYLGNPINSFTLIKRLTNDLEEIDSRVKMATDYIRNVTMKRDVKFPTREDLVGAALALTRLQKTYKLDVKELAEGILNGVRYSSPMSAGDCFELGRALYSDGDYANTAAWMTEALRKYRDEKNEDYLFDEVDILDYGSWSLYSVGDVRKAIEWLIELLALNPNHVRARNNLQNFEKELAQLEEQSQNTESKSLIEKESYSDYDGLCRGDYELSPEITKKLSCFYLTENHPFLRLAPIKAEQAYADPDVYLFYDVITDNEIEHIKNMSRPRFQRATVLDSNTGDSIAVTYRISKTAFISDQESEIITRLSRRVGDFTGLNMHVAENLQISNYGIGGHYAAHYDFIRKDEGTYPSSRSYGNRIATVLFYMSEVAQGGATVFPKLGLSVFPVKNSALFWLNLHSSGEGNLATLHAACPVLRGSKWVSNKWIHYVGQEMFKPCTLDFQAEETIREYPPPVLKVKSSDRK